MCGIVTRVVLNLEGDNSSVKRRRVSDNVSEIAVERDQYRSQTPSLSDDLFIWRRNR